MKIKSGCLIPDFILKCVCVCVCVCVVQPAREINKHPVMKSLERLLTIPRDQIVEKQILVTIHWS